MKIIRSDADFCRVRLVKSTRAALVAALAASLALVAAFALVAALALGAALAAVAALALVAAIASRSSGGAGVWATSALLTWGTVATAPCRRLVRGSKIGKV